jgi:hypothetical protein
LETHTHRSHNLPGRGPSRPRLLDKKENTRNAYTMGLPPLLHPTAPRLYSHTAANLPTPPHPRRPAPRGREGSKTQAAGVIVSRHTPAAIKAGGGVGRAGLPSPAQEQAGYTQSVLTTSRQLRRMVSSRTWGSKLLDLEMLNTVSLTETRNIGPAKILET